MAHVPTSPRTPSRYHRRRPSQLSQLGMSSPPPYPYNANGLGSPMSPQNYAGNSFGGSPTTPRQMRRKESGSISMSSDGIPALAEETGGLGNLADELADAWGDEDMDQSTAYLGHGEEHNSRPSTADDGAPSLYDMPDFGMGMPIGRTNSPSPTRWRNQENQFLSPVRRRSPKKSAKSRYHQRTDSAYDGSDYGEQSDLEADEGISPTLAARIADIEALGRLGKGDVGLESDDVVQRAIASLRDLGAQSGIENGSSRLMVSHASLTSHLTNQTRAMQTSTHSILKTPFPNLDEDELDQLIDMISDLLPLLPYPPQPSPLQSLSLLISSTAELTHLLRSLSDTLHESRLTTNTASRRLKTVKDMVEQMRKEEEERDFGTMWIQRGNWDERLRGREAGKICREVVSGFESTCEGWRERLLQDGGPVAA